MSPPSLGMDDFVEIMHYLHHLHWRRTTVKDLARALELPYHVFYRGYYEDHELLENFIFFWLNEYRGTNRPTWRSLVNALNKIGEHHIAMWIISENNI